MPWYNGLIKRAGAVASRAGSGASAPFRRAHPWVRRLEPWGILLALVAFTIDYSDRVEERTVRAWQLLTTEAPGNSGKAEALTYLNSEGRWCSWIELDWFPCKRRVELVGIDLSVEDDTPDDPTDDPPGAWLQGAKLANANLTRAHLARANLRGADLTEADLIRADLRDANLLSANLTEANLHRANLRDANLGLAGLTGAHLFTADLTNARLDLAVGITQLQLDVACGSDVTGLIDGLVIKSCRERCLSGLGWACEWACDAGDEQVCDAIYWQRE